jgi:uncharacterized membrane protein YkvA (DUF1232 family)
MDTSQIEDMIAAQCGDLQATDELQDLLAAVAEQSGVVPGKSELENGARFVCSYIQQVPYMLKVAWTAACNVGLEKEFGSIVERVQSYWLQDHDVIPDQLGIIGLLDDAYCSLTSLQTVSDYYQLQTGKHLFPEDLTAANQAMRKIIGEPYGSNLDQIVSLSLQEAGIVDALKSLASPEKQMRLANRATIWSHDPAGQFPVEELRGLGLLEPFEDPE